MNMEEPCESPTIPNTSRPAHGETTALSSDASAAPYVWAVLICCGVSWFSLLYGVALAFQDMFSAPPPPESDVSLAIAGVSGLAGEIIGARYFMRHDFLAKGKLLASSGIAIVMLFTAPLVLLTAVGLLHDLTQ
jgi:hypothetical protein